jgi:hypothetical protein
MIDWPQNPSGTTIATHIVTHIGISPATLTLSVSVASFECFADFQ